MSTNWSRIAGALAGVIFAFLLFFSLTTVDPLIKASDAELLEWWSLGSNLGATIVSSYLVLLSVPFFLAFLVQFRSRLRSEEGAGGWSELVFAAGLVFAATISISGTVRGVIAQSVKIGDEPLPGVDVLRFATEFSQLSYGVVAIAALAIMVGVSAAIILRTGALAKWVGWLGLPVAALSFVAVALQAGGWASPLLLIWVLAASFSLARTTNAASDLADLRVQTIGSLGAASGS